MAGGFQGPLAAMMLDATQIAEATRRFHERAAIRARNLRLMDARRDLEVDTPERVEKFLRRRGLAAPSGGLLEAPVGAPGPLPPDLALERILGRDDLMGIAFLEEGLRAARTVARIWVGVAAGKASGYGTGFMVSPRLMMTNHHVLADAGAAAASLAEFEYQRRADGTLAASSVFSFEPDVFFHADRELDYAVVAVRGLANDGRPLAGFGHNRLDEAEGKAIAAQWANVIQHPGGEPKQLSLRENRIVDVLPDFLHYVSDTAPGSSGAPVFNDRWEVVAAHHSGVPDRLPDGRIKATDGGAWEPAMGEHRIRWIANEGVRISRIIRNLRTRVTGAAQQALFEAMQEAPARAAIRPENAAPVVATPSSAEVATLGPDGTATWTIPLTLSIRIGAPPAAAGPPSLPAPPVTAPPGPADGAAGPDAILAAARAAFAGRADLIGLRLGYVFRDGRITRERALVASVRRRRSVAALREAGIEPLPESFRGLRIQVSEATLAELLAERRGAAAATELLGLGADAVSAEITYRPPAEGRLERVRAPMRVVAHVSPDAGWTQLGPFLGKASRSLVVGMYDFGAPHIVETIAALARKRGFREMRLVMQPGGSVGTGTKAKDLPDREAAERLAEAFGRRFALSWVKTGLVNGWVATSYHIKVAVRDAAAFWLSSGNWQSSNQPQGDPLGDPRRRWLTDYNRDWHAIVEHRGLAATLERFLRHDFDHNAGQAVPEAPPLPELLAPEALLLESAAERARPFRLFPPLDARREFDVQPLLTPDNYHEAVLALIRSAREELLIHNQTFNAPRPSDAKLAEIMDAILERQQRGVAVRIAFRILMKADARRNLEALQDRGFDMAGIRVQRNLHTKGIVVDRRRVMLGSQNLSEQGVSLNRDASLLFEDEELARYFADIFDHDWENLASDSIDIVPGGFELTEPGTAIPAGMQRIGLREVLETL